ncbi:carbohydrate ABC transporter permease [Microbacterium thalassium]|uniref:ABC-type glycerol-3-phosphate transport system permease component n=1 Tax=Microbacterium thalassium TaxID=362649 RepID=A0A7X0KTX8_9MICO|nr:carbohydrate ABC transporter permease [Microbacterium thalassium]MBB6390572.1 ABC-type glycerol-3-phosphate transport system permease component [Microbacterium thalassium]GLK25683.1 sugar ABC transporter permease [Microbacterium thalassium]
MAIIEEDLTTRAVVQKTATPSERKRKHNRVDGKHAGVGTYILVILAVALFGIPFLWIVLASIATPTQFSQGAEGLLNIQPTIDNFVEAVTRINFGAYAMNSLILATISSVLGTAASATVGFAFARLRGKGQNVLFTIVVATMMIPHIALLIPTYMMFSRVGLVGTYWPWVLWGLSGTPYLIFLFRQFFTAIPLELEDAAIIDGCGWVRTYVQIFLPLAKPVLLTSLILSFTWAWGDYLAPALLLNYDNTTLAVATAAGYIDPRGNGLPTIQAAGALLYLMPVVVLFLFAQKQFMGSSVGSGVKG